MLLHCVLNRNLKMKSTNSLQIKSFRCSFFLPIKNILFCLFEVFIANLHSTLTKSKKTGFWADGLKRFVLKVHLYFISNLDISTRKFILWLNVFFQTDIIWQGHAVGMDLNDAWNTIKTNHSLPQKFVVWSFHWAEEIQFFYRYGLDESKLDLVSRFYL